MAMNSNKKQKQKAYLNNNLELEGLAFPLHCLSLNGSK
jgi:hypothetical protein